jgi:hypothetical protein
VEVRALLERSDGVVDVDRERKRARARDVARELAPFLFDLVDEALAQILLDADQRALELRRKLRIERVHDVELRAIPRGHAHGLTQRRAGTRREIHADDDRFHAIHANSMRASPHTRRETHLGCGMRGRHPETS